MDWAYAIERHRQPLLGIVATLYAMIGLTGGGRVERLTWPIYRAVLLVLRSAEAAVRRLIVVAARGLVVKPRASRPAPAGLAIAGKGRGRVGFQLFDPRTPRDALDGRRRLSLSAVRSFTRCFAPGRRLIFAAHRTMRSMRSSANAIGSPAPCSRATRLEIFESPLFL